jgi:membrane protease YdiL (CAAX protease family)
MESPLLHPLTPLTLVDHLLVVLIALGLPLRAWFGMKSLKATSGDLAALRRRMWLRALATQWGLVAIVAFLWVTQHRDPRALGLDLQPTAGLLGVLVGLATIVSLVVRQRGAIATDEDLRQRIRDRLAPVERLMPRSRGEYPLFAALAITAGVCEELLFRGYLFWYASQWMPWPAAALLQAFAFGLGHAYQGARGIVLTGFAGLFFTGVRLIAGSVWPAMLVHALMDLHAGDLARRVFPAPTGDATGDDAGDIAGNA